MQALFVGVHSAAGQGRGHNIGHYIAICAIMGLQGVLRRFICKV